MDRGAGLGGEDRRSDGGALSLFRAGRLTQSGATWLLAAVSLTSWVTACSKQAPPPPDAATRLQSIVDADPAKYPALGEAKHWSNPYLVIRADRVGLLSGAAANEEQMLKQDEVLNALAELPASVWPYGRAVAILVDERGSSSEQGKAALRRNRGIVDGELRGAHVAIDWIPPS